MADAFRDSVAVVTGGASGIGAALCAALGARGARVVAADIDLEGAERVAAEARAAGGHATAAALDVTDAEAFARLLEDTAAREGRLDLLFNNAGVAIVGEVRDQSLADWRRVIDVNLNGVVHGVHAAWPIMVRQGRGHIVNIASLAGLVPSPLLTPYAATKHAVVGLSSSLRAEGHGLGVRVSAVCPGLIATRIAERPEDFRALDRERALTALGVPMIPAERCAQAILRGVARDRAVIVVTGHARLAAWAQRLAPGVVRWWWTRAMARARREARAT